MQTYRAKRILRRERNASTSPVIVETEHGTCFVKLRGAAQGTLSLVAEIIVAELAETIGLSVPQRALVALDHDTPSDDRNDELAQLLDFSRGLNLGFAFLEKARNLRADEVDLIDEETASKIVWLDALVMNPDRTPKNPNLLWHDRKPWLIDHGAALGFQHDWTRVDELTAQRNYSITRHLLHARATKLAGLDDALAARLPREAIEEAVAAAPDDFLLPHLHGVDIERRRQAYIAVLWKRLKLPRAFAQAHRSG